MFFRHCIKKDTVYKIKSTLVYGSVSDTLNFSTDPDQDPRGQKITDPDPKHWFMVKF